MSGFFLTSSILFLKRASLSEDIPVTNKYSFPFLKLFPSKTRSWIATCGTSKKAGALSVPQVLAFELPSVSVSKRKTEEGLSFMLCEKSEILLAREVVLNLVPSIGFNPSRTPGWFIKSTA